MKKNNKLKPRKYHLLVIPAQAGIQEFRKKMDSRLRGNDRSSIYLELFSRLVLIKNLGNKRGFTLAELVISIFIIGMISGLILSNYNRGRSGAELSITVQKAASDLRLMQNYTLSLNRNEKTGNIPSGGWGVVFNTAVNNKYVFFADENENHVYDTGTENYNMISLPRNVVIDSIYLNSTASASTTIAFVPPDPTTYINGSTTTIANVIFRETATNATSSVMVNPYGLIEIFN